MIKQKIIIDVDTGIDDALAIIYALQSPELEIVGFTTCFGNHFVEKTTSNTLRVLELLNKTEIPVIAGASRPLLRPNLKKLPIAIHGFDGPGNVLSSFSKVNPLNGSAHEFMIEQIEKHPGEITIVMLGPLTNLALAIQQKPDIVKQVKHVAVMGGAVRCSGNITSEAEANIYSDPESAQIVLQSGLPLTLVGLDVTMNTLLPREQVKQWRMKGTKVGLFLADITEFYMDAYMKLYPSIKGCALHDPLVVGIMIDSTFVRTVPMFVSVVTDDGEKVGKTVEEKRPDTSQSSVRVCVGVESERFLQHFVTRISSI